MYAISQSIYFRTVSYSLALIGTFDSFHFQAGVGRNRLHCAFSSAKTAQLQPVQQSR